MTWEELHVPPGHYYSPIPSTDDFLFANNNREKTNLAGINLNETEQMIIAHEWLNLYPEVIYWLQQETEKYTFENSWFFGSDAISLTLMLIAKPAKKIIEVGSGFSTALIEDINKHWFQSQLSIISVDPNPERARALNLTIDQLETKIQNVEFEVLMNLQKGDVLLIDSSHVLKAGSDVHYLFNSVIPCLASGVKIHIHDIFFPFEYPTDWLEVGIAFNEAYALQLLLRDSSKLRILYWNDFLEKTHREWFRENMPEMLSTKHQTGGIWLEVQ